MYFFQCVVMRTRAEMYQSLDKAKNYIFERSIKEDMFIFGSTMRLCPFLRNKLIKAYDYYLKFEPQFNINLYLKLDTDTIMKRI